jgi:site-specific DNA-cytosine methylase
VFRILDLCGGSGAWSKPYADAGYDVIVVDPVVDGRDVRLLEAKQGRIHGILAAPPCTVWSYARNRYPASQVEQLASLSVVDACLRIIAVQKPTWWALENPRNKLRRFLGSPRLEFYQWQYGDAGHKPTCIWGDFVAPYKHPKPRTKASTYKTSKENARPEDAITQAGFARAFYECNP